MEGPMARLLRQIFVVVSLVVAGACGSTLEGPGPSPLPNPKVELPPGTQIHSILLPNGSSVVFTPTTLDPGVGGEIEVGKRATIIWKQELPSQYFYCIRTGWVYEGLEENEPWKRMGGGIGKSSDFSLTDGQYLDVDKTTQNINKYQWYVWARTSPIIECPVNETPTGSTEQHLGWTRKK